jgi:phosphopentomutase
LGRVILIVLDGVGIGALPDAYEYNNVTNCNSLKNVIEEMKNINLYTLEFLGLGTIERMSRLRSNAPSSLICKLAPYTKANDSVPLHWEMMGILRKSFPIYKNGLPNEVMKIIEKETGYKFLGNITVTKPDQLELLRKEHIKVGNPVIYCTNDSVVQIMAMPEIIPLDELYQVAEIISRILFRKNGILRVVAKPFTIKDGKFLRLEHLRKDYTLPSPIKNNILFSLSEKNIPSIAIGKIADFFPNVPFAKTLKGKCNREHLKIITECLKKDEDALIFANLLDFDTLGHSKDVQEYAKKLKEFDNYLPKLISSMNNNDLLIITGDHGCDPTIKSIKTHTREYVPLIVYNKKSVMGFNLGIIKPYIVIAYILALYYGLSDMLKCYGRNISPNLIRCLHEFIK